MLSVHTMCTFAATDTLPTALAPFSPDDGCLRVFNTMPSYILLVPDGHRLYPTQEDPTRSAILRHAPCVHGHHWPQDVDVMPFLLPRWVVAS